MFKNGTDTAATLVCIDTVGAAKLRDAGGLLTTDVNNITNNTVPDNQIFNLFLNQSDDTLRKASLIQQCVTKKLTWEGVWDGIQELGGMPPRPASAASS